MQGKEEEMQMIAFLQGKIKIMEFKIIKAVLISTFCLFSIWLPAESLYIIYIYIIFIYITYIEGK